MGIFEDYDEDSEDESYFRKRSLRAKEAKKNMALDEATPLESKVLADEDEF